MRFRCTATDGCRAFEMFFGADDERETLGECYIFVDELQPPFVTNTACLTCVRE